MSAIKTNLTDKGSPKKGAPLSSLLSPLSSLISRLSSQQLEDVLEVTTQVC
jgi:hypothetical protein